MQSREFEISRPTILVITVDPGIAEPGGNAPSNPGRLALDRELADIRRELLFMAPHHDFELISADAVTVDDLMRLLIKLNPIAVHFAGHGVIGCRGVPDGTARCRDVQVASGDGDGGILLLDEHGKPQLVTAVALASMIESAAPAVRLLLLNACYSDAQASVLSGVVDAVVTMDGAIRDDSARAFAAAFYRALGHRIPLGKAFSQARATLAGKGCPDEGLPRLHTRNGVGADDIVLARSQVRPRPRPPGPERDSGRIRQSVHRQATRGCLAGVALALAAVAAAAYLGTFVRAGHQVEERHNTPAPPPYSPITEPDRSEQTPALPERLQCSRVDSQPTPAPQAGSPAPTPRAIATPPHAAQTRRLSAIPTRSDAPPPAATPVDDSGLGELDREIVRRYITRHRDRIRHCYEAQRMTRPILAGTVNAKFFIAPQGTVVTSTASGLDAQVAACVAGVIKGIEFPRSGVGVQVVYPFHFVPSDDGREDPSSGSGSARR